MSFTLDIRKFADNATGDIEKVIRGTSLAMFSSVILRTPVDTGRLRGNWQTSLNKPTDGTLADTDAGGLSSISKAKAALISMKAGDTAHMTNNLPYALKIEEGGSDQAPAGMVRITVQEFQKEVNKQVRKYK